MSAHGVHGGDGAALLPGRVSHAGPSASAWFLAVLRRELLLAARRPLQALLPAVFFVATASLFPLGVGPEPQTLALIAPGVIWVGALLATMLSLPALYAGDHADGSLDQLLLAPHPLVLTVLAKAFGHWLLHGLPLVGVAPLLALMFGLDVDAAETMVATLLLGTPVLSLLGGLSAALTLGVRGAALLNLVLILPLAVPALIFGAGAVANVQAALPAQAHLSLLGAIAILVLLGAPPATAAALRIALD